MPVRKSLAAIWAWITDAIGPDEVGLSVAIALILIGLWPVCGQVALVVPGVVLLWITLPARLSFLRDPERLKRKSIEGA